MYLYKTILQLILLHLIHSHITDGKQRTRIGPLMCHFVHLDRGRLTSLICYYDSLSVEVQRVERSLKKVLDQCSSTPAAVFMR